MNLLYQLRDEFGNLLNVKGDEATLVLELQLKAEGRTRKIGYIDKAKQLLHVKRNRAKHLHRVSKSYGFNHLILENAKKFTAVLLTDASGSYKMPVADILQKGRFLFFKQQGFERQIFLPIDVMNEYKI